MSARLADISTFSPFNEIFAVPMSIQQPDLFASGGTAVENGKPGQDHPSSDFAVPARGPSELLHGAARKSTSTLALESVDAQALASLCLSALKRFGPMTPDEVAAHLDLSVLSIRPRISELSKAGLIVKTGVRRANVSGCNANEWRAV